MSFKGTSSITDFSTSEVININLKCWLDDSFLKIGAYSNVTIPTSGVYGGDQHRLFPITVPGFTDGQVWRGFRENWVWESGLNPEAIRVSGAYVGGTFRTDLYVDYNKGRVVFNSGISTSSVVTANYSYKRVNVLSISEADWFNDVQTDSLRNDLNHYGLSGELQYRRIQLPAIIFENFNTKFRPYQLGLGKYSDHAIIYHILTETRNEGQKLADILCEQEDKTIFLFDVQLSAASGVWPLNYRGELNPGARTYEQLVIPKEDGGYLWRKMTFLESNKQASTKLANGLFHTPVRIKAELVLTDI